MPGRLGDAQEAQPQRQRAEQQHHDLDRQPGHGEQALDHRREHAGVAADSQRPSAAAAAVRKKPSHRPLSTPSARSRLRGLAGGAAPRPAAPGRSCPARPCPRSRADWRPRGSRPSRSRTAQCRWPCSQSSALRQQFVQAVAEAGGAGRQAVARIGARQAGREMRDRHGRAVERLRPAPRAARPGRPAPAPASASARKGSPSRVVAAFCR